MQASRDHRRPAVLRALALLLFAGAVGLAAWPVGHALVAHKHLPRAVAAATPTAAVDLPAGHRGEPAADPAPPPAAAALARSVADPADPSSIASAVTAQSPPVRGPPAEAAG